MKRNRFQNKVATSGYTLPVAAIFATLLWCAEGIYTLDMLWGWLLCGLTTYLWLETNNANALIRIRSLLTPAVYVAIMGAAFSLHSLQSAGIIACTMLASYNLLFRSYQRTDAVSPLFNSFLCIGIGSLFSPQLLYFVPFYLWYSVIFFRSLHWRTFCGAILGLILPYWFMAGYDIYTGNFSHFTAHFAALVQFQPLRPDNYQHFDYLQVSFIAWVVILSLIASAHCIRTSFNDKIRTRMLLYFIMIQELLIVVFMVLQPIHFLMLSGLLFMNSAPLIAHYFALTKGRFSNSLFILSIFILSVLALSNLWTRLSIF